MDGLAPEIVWGLIPRFVGVLYVFAFGALIFQHAVMPGIRDFAPMSELHARIRRDFPGIRRFFDFPTLLWLGDSDAVLRAIPFVGTLCGLCAIYGGALGYWALLVAWVLWLSIESRGLVFPWDTMLQEIGFLVLFLPTVHALPELRTSALPLPSVAFMVRWFVVRLMVGFGKDKFVGTTKSDLLYLRGFFVWMPLPTPLGWYAHHLPAWLLKVMLAFMFFAEVIAPFLGLFAGPLRLVSFATLTGLMVGIHATGNWGFFNVGYVLLCVSLLDVHSSIFDLGHEPWVDNLFVWPDLAIHGLMGLMFLVSLVYLPNNTWFTRSWVNWSPDVGPVPRKWQPLVAKIFRALEPLRRIAPFRLVNGYGVFPPHSMAPVRLLPVFEGSDDGIHWKQYDYRFMPSTATARPCVIAPYHARLDQLTYYLGMGIDASSLFGSLLPLANPYLIYTRAGVFDLLVQRILRNDTSLLRKFGSNPFPDRAPKLVRVGVLGLVPTRPKELSRTGHWWHVRRFGTLLPARGIESWPARLTLPEPELFHPDLVGWKRRSKVLQGIARAHANGEPPDRAVLEESDLTSADVERFWNELIPMLARDRGDWSKIHERADAIQERFGVEELYRLERVLERFAWLLRLRTEAHHTGAREPLLPVMSGFRFHLLLQEVMTDGRAAYEELLGEPARIVERAQNSTDATQLWVMCLMRYDQAMVHVTIFRGSEMGEEIHREGVPGLFEYFDFLSQQVPRGEEFRPRFVKHPDGEYTIEEFYPPPPLIADTPAAGPSLRGS